MTNAVGSGMPLAEALRVIHALRGDAIVVTSMGATREWARFDAHPLDLHYVPSAMGQASTLGLGLALAQPGRGVIAISGDGSLLMNLGCLATIAANPAPNFTLIVLVNGIYEVTGGQQTAPSRDIDFVAIAKASGIASACGFNDLAQWRAEARGILTTAGPRFISLGVSPVGDDYHLKAPGPLAERLAGFRKALAN